MHMISQKHYKITNKYSTLLLIVCLLSITDVNAQMSMPIHELSVSFRPLGVAWSPDNQFILISEQNGTHMYDILLQELSFFPGDSIVAVSWNSDGSRFATGGGFSTNQGQVQVFEKNVPSNQFSLISLFSTPHENVLDVKWSPDSTMIATLSRDSENGFDPIVFTIEIWNNESWTLKTTMYHHYLDGSFNIDWSPDSTQIAGSGKQYICGDDFCNNAIGTFFIADANTGDRVMLINEEEAASHISWSVNNIIAINWPNFSTYNATTDVFEYLGSSVGILRWHPTGNWIASRTATNYLNISDATGEFVMGIITAPELWNLDWSPNGEQLVTVTKNGVIQIWDTSLLNPTSCDTTIVSGDVTGLISAIDSANGTPEADTICLEAGTYTLSAVNHSSNGDNGLPVITTDITLVGLDAGATIERDAAAAAFRQFLVSGTGHLSLENVVLVGIDIINEK